MVHVSGHAAAGELLYCYNIVKPRCVMPIHGEPRHLRANAKLAVKAGLLPHRVLVTEDGDTLWVNVYLEPALLARLESANPFEALHGGNIADYWTALEGVSHFLYLAWNATFDRSVTLMELELQAEIDKYVSSLWLLREQNPRRFPEELHHILFERTRVDPALAGERAGRCERRRDCA